ncbi:MAG: TetR/AcrR family transcriptional regulator [Myxococcales bacterium]|nr:TetR/AcrR family transcriptional regulator [Myxococcales bacterium]
MSVTASSESVSPTRAMILRAAASAFASHGYRAATVQMIAREAGFTPPTVYAHFGNKQGLLHALIEELRTDLFAVLGRPLPEGLSLRQSLELRVRDLLELAERQRDTFAVFLVRPYDLPDLGDGEEEQMMLSMYWQALLEQHQGELGDRTPLEASLIIEGILFAWVKRWLASKEPGIASETRRLVDLVLGGVTG